MANTTKKTVEVMAAVFEPNKYHVYDVRTTGKHPVHLVDGGEFITTDMGDYEFPSDMGVFFLNTREYDILLANLKPMQFEVTEYNNRSNG